MKFLVDVNLPPRLCVLLKSHRHEAQRLFDRNLLTATDTEIWERGRVENLVIFNRFARQLSGPVPDVPIVPSLRSVQVVEDD